MNIEQKKRIVEGAPAGATHVAVFSSYVEYYGLNKPYDSHNVALLHTLSDLKTIIAQAEEIERLREKLKYYANVVDGLNQHVHANIELDALAASMRDDLTPKGEGK